jgi:hypothetical protein
MAQREDVWFTAGDGRISAWLYRDAARVSVPPKHTQRQRHFAIYVDPKLSGRSSGRWPTKSPSSTNT